jgi:cyclopropane-fatty-acyl-phospholipid synthase
MDQRRPLVREAAATLEGVDAMNLHEATPQRFSVRVPASGRVLLSLLGRLRHGRLKLVAPGGQVFSFAGESPGPKATIQLRDWRVLDDVMRTGDIGFAEAYLDERWHSPDLLGLLELVALNRAMLEKLLHGRWWGRLYYRLRHLGRANTREGARRNICAHYDLGNAFYRYWLDETMTYSAALFEGDTRRTLEEAQIAKYERILQRLDVRSTDHVLEIGCGWGGFSEYAARTRGCRVRGITLSTAQLAFASERIRASGLSDRVELTLTDYRDVTGSFDKLVSIEMFEAVGERFWMVYFSTVRDRLKPGGSALIQTITIADELFGRYRKSTDFIQQYIFPGGMLPCPGVLRELASGAGLTLRAEHCFGIDYAHTLRQWRSRFHKASNQLRALGFDAQFERLWDFYLVYCEVGFRVSSTDVMQLELHRGE